MVVTNWPTYGGICMRAATICLIAGIALGSSSLVQAQTGLVCRPADYQTRNMIRYMKVLVTATVPADSESVGVRMTYQIPVVSPTQISLVTTERICKSALTAFKLAVPGQAPAPTSIYVLAVGPVYVVWNPLQGTKSEWAPHLILNSKFQVLSQFAG